MLDVAIGKWKCHVSTLLFSTDIFMTVKNINGEYGFELEIPGIDAPEFKFTEIKETGSTVDAVVFVPSLNKSGELHVTFAGDTFNGYIKVPMLGKIVLKNGTKVKN